MNPNDSFYTVMLRLAQYEYFPVRISKGSPIPGVTTFAWVQEYTREQPDDDTGTYDAIPSRRNSTDTELFLTQAEADAIVMAPEQFMTPEQKKLFTDRHRDWELVVTEYKPQLPTIYASRATSTASRYVRRRYWPKCRRKTGRCSYSIAARKQSRNISPRNRQDL